MSEAPHRTRTLALAVMLHAFTHIYQVALLPLYYKIQEDFHLANLGTATLLLTVFMASYFIPSYGMGILADRCSRRKLLTVGLLLNGLGFVGLGLAPNYAVAVAAAILSGLGGSFFHPAATAMIARLYPVGTGRALGFLGIGASVGFFFGPVYSGWRAEMSSWRAPVIELGALGMAAALVFYFYATEEAPSPHARTAPVRNRHIFPKPALWLIFFSACLAFSLRDFAGSSMGTVGSLFLQQAHGFNMRSTGFALSTIFIASAISNPLFGALSDRGRIRWTCFIMTIGALMIVVFPRLPASLLVPAYVVYGFFFMASYPTTEAALMEAVPDAVRGRVFGLFITVGGLLGNLSHWIMGSWVEKLGTGTLSAGSFYPIYAVLSALVLVSMSGLFCLHALRRREIQEGERLPSHALSEAEPIAKI